MPTQCVCAQIPYVHEKRAVWLEDLHRFREAEEEFIAAGKPIEAVLMHVSSQAWDDAARVAEQHDPTTMVLVLEAQVRAPLPPPPPPLDLKRSIYDGCFHV